MSAQVEAGPSPAPLPLTRPRTVSRPAEKHWVWAFGLLVMLVITLPYLLAFARQGDATRFTGFLIAVEDGNSYLAKMLTGENGGWLFKTPYTFFPQNGVLFYLPFILLGKLASPPGLHDQLVALFHLARLGGGFLMILATYDFLAVFIQEVRWRRFGLILAVLGGGLGWVLVLAGRGELYGSMPLEFYSPETFGFLNLFGIPHLAAARALLLWSIVLYLRAAQTLPPAGLDWKSAVRIGILWLLTGILQPLSMILLGILLALYLAVLAVWLRWQKHTDGWVRWRGMLRLGVAAGLLSLPLLLYNLFILWKDPFIQAWSRQNYLPSPHPIHYLLAYGLLLPFAILGAVQAYRREPWKALFLVGWLAALPFLAYAPTNIQRRLVEGGWLVLVTLGMAFLDLGDVPHGSRRAWAPVLLLFVFPSTLILFAGSLLTAWKPAFPAFREVDEVAVWNALAERIQPGERVLAAYESGNALPAWAPVSVMIGHGPESVDLEILRPQVAHIYQESTSDGERASWFAENHIRYVFWGPQERKLGDWDPDRADYLGLRVEQGAYALFEVLPESAGASSDQIPTTISTRQFTP